MQSVGYADRLHSNVMNSCGNSNISTKLRGSKCLEIQEESVGNNRATELDKGDVNALSGYNTNDFNAPRGPLVICQRNSNHYSSDHSFSRFKPRISGVPRNEFRMARGGSSGDRARGALRGRAFKKTPVERDSNLETNYYSTSRPKFQESLKNQENSQGKYYDDKRTNDSRISKLLRRLCREEDYDHFILLCKQAQEGIIAAENQRYIRRNLEVTCESLLDMLHTGPGLEAKQQIAKCLGRVGYAAEQDFKRYMDWVFSKYSLERKEDIKYLLIKSFVEVFKMDAEAPRLKEFSVLMMSQLQSTLENVDRSDLLVATVDAILLIMESYPETFSNHFRDTVDILVGWHIDSTQQKAIASYASRSLQRLRTFWIADLQFTLTLLGQFLEDMESYDEELTLPEPGRNSPGDETSPTPRECILRITSLISVFNTVTKSISEHLNPNLTPNVQWSFLTDCLSKMLKTVVKAIELNDDSETSVSSCTLTVENADELMKRMKAVGVTVPSPPRRNFNKSESAEENVLEMLRSLKLDKNEMKNLKLSIEREPWSKEKQEPLLNFIRWLQSRETKRKDSLDLTEEKEELIVTANECAFLLLGHLQSRTTKNHELLYKFIDLQLKRIHMFWDDTIISMLNTVSKIIKEVSANLPLELVHKLLGKDSALLKLRFRDSIAIQNASLRVYHSLLSLKNIPLLQESYRYILSDLEVAYRLVLTDIENLVPDNPLLDGINYKKKDAEIVITFLLRALSDIANASNSIIGMWALKPSILELLAVKLRPYDSSLSITSPFLQYSILYLLYAHCSRYNHFVPSSSLITGTTACRPIDMFPGALDVPTTSPTSGHLSIILHLIAKSFNQHTPEQTLLLLSTWMQEICLQSENYIGILSKTTEYERVLESLIACGASTDSDISIAVCELFEMMVSAKKNVTWGEDVYSSIVDLATLHLASREQILRDKYGSLLTRVPLNIVVPKLNTECLLSETKKHQGIKDYSMESLILAKRLHMRGNSNGEMQAQHFKTYMAFLLQEQCLDTSGLTELFTLCWPIISESEPTRKMYRLGVANRSFLYFWAGFEAAQHCVNNKLRTSLGKPQETFTSIESALKTLAREISYNVETTRKEKRSLDDLLGEHSRVRLLIEFLEHLERVIHNAAEGCAMALPPLSKPVRTFFHTNKSTCKEWLNRIRLALCVVSLHSGLAGSALRNSGRLLEDLSNSDNTHGIEFERATLCTAQAFVMLGEAEALQGLYVYTKEKERKFPWLKAAMEEAAGHYESAAEAYKLIIEEQMAARRKDSEHKMEQEYNDGRGGYNGQSREGDGDNIADGDVNDNDNGNRDGDDGDDCDGDDNGNGDADIDVDVDVDVDIDVDVDSDCEGEGEVEGGNEGEGEGEGEGKDEDEEEDEDEDEDGGGDDVEGKGDVVGDGDLDGNGDGEGEGEREADGDGDGIECFGVSVIGSANGGGGGGMIGGGGEELGSTEKEKNVKPEGDSQLLGFCMHRLSKCYEAVSDWSRLEAWKLQEARLLAREKSSNLGKQLQAQAENSDCKRAKCLKMFEEGETIALDDLTNWNFLENETEKPGNWSCAKTLVECNDTLTNIALRIRINDHHDCFEEKVERCRRVAAKTMEEGLRNVLSDYLNESILIRYSANALKELLRSGQRENTAAAFQLYKAEKLERMDSRILTRILWWSEYFEKMENDTGNGDGRQTARRNNGENGVLSDVADLRLHIVRTARKEGNFELAKRELVNYLRSEQEVYRIEGKKRGFERVDLDFDRVTADALRNVMRVKWSKNNMRAFREYSKLLYDMECVDKALKVCSATALGISRAIVDGERSADLRENGTRLLLTLGKWIQQQEAGITENIQLEQLLEFEALHNDGLMTKLFGSTTDSIPVSDMIIGKLMQLGVNQCPDLPVAWCSFASWCYKWGRKIVDNSNTARLTDSDRSAIRDMLPFETGETDLMAIFSILSQSKTIPEDEGDITDTINDINTSDMIENQLRNVPILRLASPERLGMLVDVWKQAQKRIYSYYELSANAYFKYLQLAANKETNDCDTITATLRLLRLVVKHALELQNVLESGLSSTPTAPWKQIIPQLFSRLSHPEAYVRTRVSELLCRVAENSPHLITFPAVVGAVSGQRKTCDKVLYAKTENSSTQNDLSFMEEERERLLEHEEDEEGERRCRLPEQDRDREKIEKEGGVVLEGDESVDADGDADGDVDADEDGDEVEEEEDEHEKFMDCCFSQLVDCLSNRIQDSVGQIKILVRELRRITLLWDELWLATLCQHHTEISKRFEQLEIEVQKVQDNVWLSTDEKDRLIAEKHRIILKPVVFILENLFAMTSVPAETPHEKTFQEKFGPSIEDAIGKLTNPKNPAKPQIASLCLKQLESKLAQRVHRRAAYSLAMNDISPVLANLRNTRIAMPGVAANDNRIVTIQSVDNNVQILPTKTKPKKLIFHGSDGHVYTYLFKGLEDLHLDERIMQFLSICNTMMSKKGDSKQVYRARHYSVIPLGPRSGLIQWVDGVTPLFVLYKKWQQRENAMTNKTGSTAILRPSELFYNKLTPLLKERGIGLENRKEWPAQVLKQVLAELMAETPKDLLAKEIWCNSIDAGNWWQATKNYSYSVAVMSIIGYIIGLGDRHLDNVLVDLNTGEVVHIDYNVCFEKGKTLRVPEKVPFRMTPNIKTALGVTGVEGIFRLACEHTLRVMRRGRETLLTLLEAFVYDPLVDWRAGADNSIASYGACQARARCTGIGRKQLEQELTRAMFAVRTAEMRTEWLANRDELIKVFPSLCHRLNCWMDASEITRQCRELLQDRHQQLALVKEAQAMGRNHPLYSVIKRYNSFKRARDAHEKAKAALKERIEDCEKQINMHNLALSAIRGVQLGQWLSELGTSTNSEEHVVFDLVKEFLQNAGQSQMIVQCEQSENELTQLATQQSILIRSCLDLLSQYSAICNLYPLSIMSQHRTVLYHGWANKLLNSGNVDSCLEIMAQFESTFDPLKSINNQHVQQILTFSYQMQGILNEANERWKKAYERMVSEGLPESVGRIEKAYTESRVQIQGFLRREKGAERALECVNITALCALNKRYLMMEVAAKCAGDCLVDLTSREGDWFLDEMRLMSSLISELVTLIPECHKANNNDPRISLVLKCLRGSDYIYKGLQELNYNFHTIILPEAMKTIITEEPTVIRMIGELTEIIVSPGIPLGEILGQLEMHLRFTVMEMDSPHAMMQSVVNNMRLRFEALLSRTAEIQEPNQDETLTPGQMLLMGFNGLFEKLQMEGNALIGTLSTLDIPAAWRKIDQIREAKEMSAPIFNKAACQVLEDIFLVKRLRTIQEFFMMCRDIATAFKGGLANLYDDERLNKPIRIFTADYVSRQLLGVTSQTLAIALCLLLQRMGLSVTTEIEQRDIGAESKVSLEELCRKVVDLCLKRGSFSGSVLAQASALSSTLESAWRRKQTARLTQQCVEVARASMQRLQLQLTAHHWLHEDSLLLRPNLNMNMNLNLNLNLINPLNRSAFMLELRKTAAGLSSLQSRVCEAREQQQNLVSSAVQRLKWAAGANPALGEVMSAFDNAVLSSCEKLTRQHNLATNVVSACNSILHYEALRTRTSESVTHDANFVKLVKHWEESCVLTMSLTITVTAIEESLVELLPMESTVDINWLKQAERFISEAILDVQKKLQEKEECLHAAQVRLREQISNLQNVLTEHHRLMSDVRILLRTMAKQENIAGLQEFLCSYRSFTESVSAIVKELESDCLDANRGRTIKQQLESMATVVPSLYNELLEFANEKKKLNVGKLLDKPKDDRPEKVNLEKERARERGKKGKSLVAIRANKKKKLIRQEGVCHSPKKGTQLTRDPTTGKAVQERNAYALNVWRRIRMKLEGRDPHPSRKYTTAEQVEYVIREAQSTDNLALLYEGWTPWV
ncbi:serine/threonine-protein kinase Smg1 isoform X2 [Halictus rubicundus]|uniref:serine/threonine-protein kinase Smg1 isoform X2 n=1 Tax=Halictus rubicundus TaxID=77578 RepID=UPI0040351E3D